MAHMVWKTTVSAVWVGTRGKVIDHAQLLSASL